MSDLTDDQVRALLDGATPGPWRADGEPWNRVVWSSAENRVCFMAHSNGLNDDRDIATSELIAQAPTLATDLADALDREADALEREAALREALEPFKAMSGELFARNWNKDDVVIALDNPGDPRRLTFGDFLDLHAALAAFRGAA